MKDSEKKYIKLLSAIRKIGGVVCEQVPHIFFPEDSIGTDGGYAAEKRLALQICSQCPVQKLCADYAMTANEPYGVWGGTLPTDR
jgi:WhiB family redox-sensing transcriptional regulator